MNIDETLNKLQEALLAGLDKEEENREKNLNAQESQRKTENEALIKHVERNKEIFYRFDSIFRNIVDGSKNNAKKVAELKKLMSQIDDLIQIRAQTPFKGDLEFLNSLHYLKKHVSEYKLDIELANPHSDEKDSSDDIETFMEFNKSDLTRNQIVFIMSAMRSSRITLSNINNTKLAEAFHILTGLSKGKLREFLGEFEHDKIEYSELEKSTLKDTLEKITKAIARLPSKNK